MKCKLIFFVLFLLTIPVAFAEPARDGDPNPSKDPVILIIRHAEKPDEGSGLSAAGEARAEAYVNYFKNFKIDGQPLNLDYLFASRVSSASDRPGLTLAPTAKALGLTIDSQYGNNQFQKLADKIQSRLGGKNILICWHHGNIPGLLQALGANPDSVLPNGKWPSDVFGWLIMLRYDENGHLLESKRIDENLL
jgi:broad specificity phosphatase PhoE